MAVHIQKPSSTQSNEITSMQFWDVSLEAPAAEIQRVIGEMQKAIADPSKPVTIEFNQPSQAYPDHNIRWVVRCMG